MVRFLMVNVALTIEQFSHPTIKKKKLKYFCQTTYLYA